jgi:transposase
MSEDLPQAKANNDPGRGPATQETSSPSAGAVPASASPDSPPPLPPPRLRCPDRQIVVPAMPLEDLVEPDHPVRKVWGFVATLDLSLLYQRIRSRANGPGRTPIDPRLLVALWLFAIHSSVVSARQLADLCVRHNAYRWLCGGIAVNHHTLSDFLVEHTDFLEQLLKHSVAVLRPQGLVSFDRVAQDGMRVRASAGAASFHRQATLQKQLEEAQAEVQRLQEALCAPQGQAQAAGPTRMPEVISGQEDAGGHPKANQEKSSHTEQGKPELSKQQAAEVRAAVERLARAEQALKRVPEMEAKKKPQDKAKARVSSTDPEATVMKMADGGFRPAYNIHFSTDCDSQVVLGVAVVQTGSDQGQLQPMLAQVEERFEQRPKKALVDGGFVKLDEIEEIQKGEEGRAATTVYAPVPAPKKEGVDRHAVHAGDSKEVAEWRKRMATEEAKELYKERAQTAECVNAQARNRGLVRLLVRGVRKVKAVALWFAAVHNMARGFALLAEQAAEPCVT